MRLPGEDDASVPLGPAREVLSHDGTCAAIVDYQELKARVGLRQDGIDGSFQLVEL
jgi:hypothetical protein